MKQSNYLTLAMILASLTLMPAALGEATTLTIIFQDEVIVVAAGNPCTGVPGTVTQIQSGVIHITIDEQGGEHLVLAQQGSFTLTQVDGVVYTAHFADTFARERLMASSGVREITQTSTLQATGSDGTSFVFIAVFHRTINPDGTTTSFLFKLDCR